MCVEPTSCEDRALTAPAADLIVRPWLATHNRGLAMEFLTTTEAAIAAWHGITCPNDPARRLAADLAATIAAFEAVRESLCFEDEPSSFAVALRECKE